MKYLVSFFAVVADLGLFVVAQPVVGYNGSVHAANRGTNGVDAYTCNVRRVAPPVTANVV